MAKYFVSLLLALFLGVGSHLYQNPHWFQLTSVSVEGSPKYLNRTSLLDDVKPLLAGNLWHVPVKRIERNLQEKPWVDRAVVKRQFPHVLRISIQERVPLGRWRDDGLVDAHAQVFRPESIPSFDPSLPVFFAQKDSLAEQVVKRCQQMISRLAMTDIDVTRCGIDARGAWMLTLAKGAEVILGVKDVDKRLVHLMSFLPKLKQDFPGGFSRIDLRYRHGFALRRSKS